MIIYIGMLGLLLVIFGGRLLGLGSEEFCRLRHCEKM